METNQIDQQTEARQRIPVNSEVVKRIVRDASEHPTYPRMCLQCGSFESLDGSVPCGH